MKKKCFVMFAFAAAAVSAFARGVPLDGEWTLSFWKQPEPKVECPSKAVPEKTIKAVVPGNVEIDMQNAGLIKEPRVGENVFALRKYEGYQWLYSRTFQAPELADGERAILNLRGVDTLSAVFVNGKKIGETANMLIAHKFDITDSLKRGENKIEILLSSVVIEAGKYSYPATSTRKTHSEGLEIRKAPHMFGWDIMPRLVSAGLWRSVSIDVQKPERIAEVFWFTQRVNLKKKSALLSVQFRIASRFEKLDGLRFNMTVSRNGKNIVDVKGGRFETYNSRNAFQVRDVDFWWPRTMGEPALYDAKIELTDESGKVLDTDLRRIGLRSLKLEYSDIYPDKDGKFEFVVNGVPMFAFGSNWVQLDALHSRDAALLRPALEMARELNCNMLRCWGGNVYEDDAFYDFCDENGILIWQDFSMSCSGPAQSEHFKKLIAEEVADVVLRLRNRPSVALWAGNNENDIMIGGGLREFKIDPSRDQISRNVLPEVLFSTDPTRPYLPSSPFVSPDVFAGKARPSEDHLWGPRGYYKADFYTKSPAKFVSEIGYHGCPNRESLEKMFDREFVHPWGGGEAGIDFNAQWQCKAVVSFPYQLFGSSYEARRNKLMAKQTKIIFGEVPNDLDDFIFASQFVQAEAKKYFIEMMRTKKGDRSGILWWNLRDGWPIISDAVVDYYNSKKLAYYFIKRVQENACVMINDSFEVFCANETLKPVKVSAKVSDAQTGKVLCETSAQVGANSLAKLASLPAQQGQGLLLIDYEVDGKKLRNHYVYGKPPFALAQAKKWVEQIGVERD